MPTVKVQLGSRSYPISIETGLRTKLLSLIRPFLKSGSPAIVLTDTHIQKHYSTLLLEFKKAGLLIFTIKAGEQSKTLSEAERILAFMLKNQLDRSSLLIAMGGGVVGDLGGLVSALYMRGIQFVQVPTTLLSQVDSSVGGKTGVNHPLGKNMIGAFHQPKAVFIDPGFLKTLPKAEFLSGYGEVIKHALIRNRKLFYFLRKNHEAIMAQSPKLLETMIAANCKIKAEVVSKDETEAGLRAILNFGHSYGHALETLTHYTGYTHGGAVMLGMVAAVHTSLALKLLSATDAQSILSYLNQAGLPKIKRLSEKTIYAKMFSDKKARAGKLTLILPTRIGKVCCVEHPTESAVMSGIRAISRPNGLNLTVQEQ